jgi:hypothetical protein
LISKNIDILTTFSGSSIGKYKWENNCLVCELSKEPVVHADYETHNYNLHFILGIKNKSQTTQSFDIIIKTDGGHPKPDVIFTSDSSASISTPNLSLIKHINDGYSFRITLAPLSETYCSNTIWSSLELVESEFVELCNNSDIKAIEYGVTCNNYPLTAYQLFKTRRKELPLIYISSGSHPMEGDTIATRAIASYLLEKECTLRERADFMIIPLLNPDGFKNGLNGCNGKGINFFWDFQNNNLKDCPEAYYFWELLKQFPPNIYIDFHSYSIQGTNKTFGPYIKPSVLYSGTSTRASAIKLANKLQTIPGSQAQSMFAPSSLPYKITREFNTITFAKYHLHQDMGVNGMRDTALLMLEKVICSLNPMEFHHQLLQPYGNLRKPIMDRIKQYLFMNRYYFPKMIKNLTGASK